jgi:hypothetical protein
MLTLTPYCAVSIADKRMRMRLVMVKTVSKIICIGIVRRSGLKRNASLIE